MTKAFTLIELIIAIVIIGVLSAVAIPQFAGIVANSKISSERATAASVQTILDTIHSDWVLNGDCNFTWGNSKLHDPNDANGLNGATDLNNHGYPKALDDNSTNDNELTWILRESDFKYVEQNNPDKNKYYGPASDPNTGVSENDSTKPDKNDYWEYNATNGTFTLNEN